MEQARLPRDHPSLLVILYNLARAHDATGHHDQALKLFDDALDRAQANHGDDHRTLLIMQGKAMALRKSGRTNEALELAERVSALTRAKRGPDHPETLSSMNNLGVAYLSVRQFSQAVAVLQEAVLLYERRYPPDSPEPLGTMENLLVAYEKNEPGRSRTYTIQCWLGETLARQKKYSEAEQYYLSGYAGLKKLEATDPSTARQAILEDTASHIDKLYETWGEIQKAAHWRENLR